MNATQSMQLFAHDVRRPFSMLKSLIYLIETEKDPEEIKNLLRESRDHVQNTIATVDGMIADLLAMGSKSKPITQVTFPKILIESTLQEVMHLYPNSDAQITSSINCNQEISIDIHKIKRVLINIVENAPSFFLKVVDGRHYP